jgi:hypothetical protein
MNDQRLMVWLNLGSLVMLIGLVCDFVWVITTALNVH